MLVLGIESSCDETSAAVVAHGWTLLGHVIASQSEIHAPYGGVVPELASRRHVELILPVIEEAMRQAGVTPAALSGIAVTNRPGLIGSLLVGVTAAKAMALAHDLPLVGIHHLEGHLFSNWLERPDRPGGAVTPAVALVASGGHTELYLIRDLHDYVILGRRRDDAAGEAFDKGARLLGLAGGGAALDQLARSGDPTAVAFPRTRTDPPLDFSFSGVKTALLRLTQRSDPPGTPADIAAGYQHAIVEAMVERSILALELTGVATLLVCGGVAANTRLRARLAEECERIGATPLFPPGPLCTDNAGMIAAAGASRLQRGERHGLELETFARSPLTTECLCLSVPTAAGPAR